MIFVSVAEAARHLGIDVKTLHRWLADAQLPLQSHPNDGRKKGMSHEHLQVLARLHQRRLASLPEVPSRVQSEIPPLPAALLEMPEQLSCLQAQIAVLHQHVADITRLLQSSELASAVPAASTTQTRATNRPSTSASQVPRSRPTAKTPRKPVHVIACVEYGSRGSMW